MVRDGPAAGRERLSPITPYPARRALVFLSAILAGSTWLACGRDDDAPSEPAKAAAPAPAIDRHIRVLLLEDIPRCRLYLEGPAMLRGVDGATLATFDGATGNVVVAFTATGIHVQPLGVTVSDGAAELVPQDAAPVGVDAGDELRRYRGTMRLVAGDAAAGSVINVVDLEAYLVGVVSSELYAHFHEEAFRAQAVAARTYAWYQMRTAGRRRAWDVKATESSQVYRGLGRGAEVPKAAGAVRDTCGVVCTWPSPDGERIFCTYYSSTCGGSTQAAGPVKREPIIPPLAGNVTCEYCRDSPDYRWGPVTLTKAAITQRLRAKYPKFEELGPIERIDVTELTPSGRPVILTFTDAGDASIELEAENFRLVVDPAGRTIKSTFFNVEDRGERIVLKNGRGFGHGIGLCQYGAEGLAKQGRTVAEILNFYYPTSRLTRAY